MWYMEGGKGAEQKTRMKQRGRTSVLTQPSRSPESASSLRAAASAACSLARCASVRCLYWVAGSRGASPRAGAPASTGSSVSDPLPSRLCSFAARWISDEKNLPWGGLRGS